jgi:hypothetical protein
VDVEISIFLTSALVGLYRRASGEILIRKKQYRAVQEPEKKLPILRDLLRVK